MTEMYITDYYGCQVKVTDLAKAIEQAEFCADSPYGMTHYNTSKYEAIPEAAQITVGAYYKDMLVKLKAIEKG